jgi:hypothetical protein
VVKTLTGNEAYNFGDLTKILKAFSENDVHELIDMANVYWNTRMKQQERDETFTVAVFTGAIVILAYNFVANVVSGLVFAYSWTKISSQTGVSPLSNGNIWSQCLKMKQTMDIFFGGPCVPAKAIVTIPFFFKYRRFVVGIANKSPLRKQFPIVNRYTSLILSWVVANLGVVGGLTLLIMKLGSLKTGISLFAPVISYYQ